MGSVTAVGLFTASQVYQRLEFLRWGFIGATDIVLEAAIARPLVMGVEVPAGVCFDFWARGILGAQKQVVTRVVTRLLVSIESL